MTNKLDDPPRLNRNSSIAALVPKIAGKALGKYGLSHGNIVTRWSAIVGPRLAEHAIPEILSFPKRQGDQTQTGGATLTIRAAGAFVPELTHRIPEILSRINSYFGYEAVTSIKIKVAAWRDVAKVSPSTTALPPTKEQRLAIEQATSSVTDEQLRSVLAQLGCHIVVATDK